MFMLDFLCPKDVSIQKHNNVTIAGKTNFVARNMIP